MQATEDRTVMGAGFRPLAEQIARDMAYADAMDFHRARIRVLVEAVLGGHIAFCPGVLRGKFQPKMEAGDIWHEITVDMDDAEKAKLLVLPVDNAAKDDWWTRSDELITAYVDKTAAALAREEVGL